MKINQLKKSIIKFSSKNTKNQKFYVIFGIIMYENWNKINAVIINTVRVNFKFKKIMPQALIQVNLKTKIENKYI